MKNIRKLNRIKFLFLTDDKNIKNNLSKSFIDCFNEIEFVETCSEALTLLEKKSYGIIAIDMDTLELNDFCNKLKKNKSSAKIIAVSKECNDEALMLAINNDAYTLFLKPIEENNLKATLIMCLNQTKRGDKIEFKNDIHYDAHRDQFFKNGDLFIEFTKLEKSLLKLFIDHRGDIVDYETIKSVVWKEKNMSVFTMRNIVNKIRQKSYYGIIKNVSNKGYTIDIVK